VAWGDYNNDGRLDALIISTNGFGDIYRSYVPISNQPPSAPTNLRAEVVSNRITFTWSAALDDHTPPQSLTYNLRIGTTPGGTEVMAPLSDLSSGYRRVARMGNAQLGTNAWLTGLMPNRPYYWSVQAVDGALAGGPFASEARFGYATTNVAPVTITRINREANGSVRLQLSGIPGVVYTIETAPGLVNWKAKTNGQAGASGAFELIIPPPGTAQNFYRAAFP
jgi:hypothetical protein